MVLTLNSAPEEFIQKKYSEYQSIDDIERDPILNFKEVYTIIATNEYMHFDEIIRAVPRIDPSPLHNCVKVLVRWGYLERGKKNGRRMWLAKVPEKPVPAMAGVRTPSELNPENDDFFNRILNFIKEHPKSNIYEIVYNNGGSISIMRYVMLALIAEKMITAERDGLFVVYSLTKNASKSRKKDIKNNFTINMMNNRSLRKAILVHLLRFIDIRTQHMLPFEITQGGMSEILGKPQNTLSVDIRRLLLDKLIICERRHVTGQKRVLKTYFLTAEGIAAARDLLKQEMVI